MTDSYQGTRGHSGSDASKDAAIAERDKGTTSRIMQDVLEEVEYAGTKGVTSADIRRFFPGEHHGRLTSALTKLHIAGDIVALTERRENCGVYVLPGLESGREVRPYRRQNVKLQVVDVMAVMDRHNFSSAGCSCGAEAPFQRAHRRHVADLIVALSRGEL